VPETIVEFHNGQIIEYMLNPDGIIYVNVNNSGATPSLFYDLKPDLYDPEFAGSDPTLPGREPGVEFPNRNNYYRHVFPAVTKQTGLYQFGAITINGSDLYFNTYVVHQSGNNPVQLLDGFAIRKNSFREVTRRIRNLPATAQLTPAHITVVLSIIAEYNRLTPADQAQVNNIDELWAANDVIQEIMRAEAETDVPSGGGCGSGSVALGGAALGTLATLSVLFFVKSKKE